MKLKILGCGTSTGVPLPGCSCEVCNSGDPFNYRDRASALVIGDDGATVLVDATPDLRQQCLKYQIKRVDAVLFTHAHADHILGTDDLRCFNFASKQALVAYASRTTAIELTRFFHYIFEPDPNYQGGGVTKLSLNCFENGDELTILSHRYKTFAVDHGGTSVTGFRLGALSYVTDCKQLREPAKAVIRGSKYLILDGLREEKPHPTHLTIEEAIALSQTLDVEQTYLTHMAHTVDYHTVSKKLPAGVALCYDGLDIDFTV